MSVRKRTWTTNKGEPKTAWVVDYRDQAGKRRHKSFTRKKEADAFSARAHTEVADGVHVADRATVTVTEAGELWIATATNAGREASTIAQYRQHLTLHIAPYLGARRLSELSVPVIRVWQDQLSQDGRSAAMVKRATTSLDGLISDSMDRGLVVRNVVREMARRRSGSRAHEARQKEPLRVGRDIPTGDEIRAIVEALEGRYRPILLTAIFTGLRASELRGLRWPDIDLARGELQVRQRADRYDAIGPPKSKAGYRTVPLPPIVTATLREWRLACPMAQRGWRSPTAEATSNPARTSSSADSGLPRSGRRSRGAQESSTTTATRSSPLDTPASTPCAIGSHRGA